MSVAAEAQEEPRVEFAACLDRGLDLGIDLATCLCSWSLSGHGLDVACAHAIEQAPAIQLLANLSINSRTR